MVEAHAPAPAVTRHAVPYARTGESRWTFASPTAFQVGFEHLQRAAVHVQNDIFGEMVLALAAEIPSAENGGLAEDGMSVTWKLKLSAGVLRFFSDRAPRTVKGSVRVR